MFASETSGKFRAEFVDPESNGFVADRNITFGKKVLNVANAEIEPVVEPNGVLDDGRRESMTLVDVFHHDMLPEGRLTCQYQQDGWPHEADNRKRARSPSDRPQIGSPYPSGEIPLRNLKRSLSVDSTRVVFSEIIDLYDCMVRVNS